MQINWDEFYNGRVAIYCKSKEDLIDFLTSAHKTGAYWVKEDQGLNNLIESVLDVWSTTSYDICFSTLGTPKIVYASKDYYTLNKNKKIVHWKSLKNKKTLVEAIDSIYKDETYDSPTVTIKCDMWGEIIITPKEKSEDGTIKIMGDVPMFTKVEKPVDFEEVLVSDKNCRVEHELITHPLYKKYCEFSLLLSRIVNEWEDDEVKDIIKNGKWYLEE